VDELSVDECVAAFTNEVAGNKKYRGRPIIVSAYVDRTEEESGGALLVLSLGARFPVYCRFPKHRLEQVARAQVGKWTSILGICNGIHLDGVLLEDCEVVSDIKKYRVVPSALQERFRQYQPTITCGRRGPELDGIFRANQGAVVEVSGYLWAHPDVSALQCEVQIAYGRQLANGEVEGVDVRYRCHFDRQYADDLAKVRRWPVKIRGQVKAVSGHEVYEIERCGMVLDDSQPQ
jgi:hypothetical protein